MCIYKGEQFNSDTARIINKFDIYVCDLGEIADNSLLGKSRPCVIISNDDYNSPKNGQYLIAPIRTEHQMEVSRENLDYITQERKKYGRIYVPIEMSPEDFRFIDITQLRQVSSSNVTRYVSTIINYKLRKRINDSLFEFLFSKEEAVDYKLNTVNVNELIPTETVYSEVEKQINEDITTEPKVIDIKEKQVSKLAAELQDEIEFKNPVDIKIEENTDTKPKRKHTGGKPEKHLPMGFSLHYKKLKAKRITHAELAEKCGMSTCTLRKKIKEFEAEHPDLVASL